MPQTPNFSIGENDRLPPLVVTLLDGDGNIVDLTAATSVAFHMVTEDRATTKVNAAATINSPATDGEVQYDWVSADTDTPGLYLGEWEVTFTSGKKETFPNRRFKYLIEVVEELA